MKIATLKCLLALALVLSLCGCYSAKISEPPRTAIELTLLSTASDRAVAATDLSWSNGKKVFVEEKYFDSYDKPYVIGLIRDHFSSSGALLTTNQTNADLIVEIRSGGLGMGTSETLFGLPSITFPIPLSGPVQTPELAIYKSQLADSVGKFAMLAYERDNGAHFMSVPPTQGRSYFHLYKILGVSWKRTDVPELQKHPKDHLGQPAYPSVPQPPSSIQSSSNSVPPH